MIASRVRALLLSLVLVSPAAAQVRAVPIDAGAAPLTAHNAGISPSLMTPALSGPTLASSLSAPSDVIAPSALAPETHATAGQHVQPAQDAVARPAALIAASVRAPQETRSGASSPARRAPAKDASGAETFAAAEETPLDQLYDGRAEAENLSSLAYQGTETEYGPALSPPPPPRVRGRAEKIVDVAVPIAVAGVVALGFASPHLGLGVLHALGQTAYWLANPLAFMFTVPQIFRILKHRSAEVSKVMTAIGLISAFVTALSFAFDGKSLMMYRNLAQTAGFAGMLGLEMKYGSGKGNNPSSSRRAMIKTGAFALAFGAVMLVAGHFLMIAVPSIALMSSLLVPFQIFSGFGFTYMMYAQLRKMYFDHSAGDASSGMMWAYLGTKVIWVWSLATMLSFVSGPAWLVLGAGALFSGVSWLITRFALTNLIHSPWSFLPEKITIRGHTLTRRVMSDALAFLALAALILALSGAGHLAFASLIGIKAGSAPLFAMYLLYTVQNLVAAMATSKTLRLQGRLGRKAAPPRP